MPDTLRINIDHHPTNTCFGDFSVVNKEASSTAEVLCSFLNEIGYKLSPSAASDLLTAVLVETESLTLGNTKPSTLGLVSELTRLGANATAARQWALGLSWSTLKAWGRALRSSKLECNGDLIVAIVREARSRRVSRNMGLIRRDPSFTRLANLLLNTWSVKGAALLRPGPDAGTTHVSLRSRPNCGLNVRILAERLGGGGHDEAAAAVVEEEASALRPKVVSWFSNELTKLRSR